MQNPETTEDRSLVWPVLEVRRQVRDALIHLAWRLGLTQGIRAQLASRGRFVLLFHGVAAQRHTELPSGVQPELTAAQLQACLCWLGDHFQFLTPDEFLMSDQSGVLLTFDDGLANNCTHALPLLEEFCAPAVFFVSTQHILSTRDWLPATRDRARRAWPSIEDVPPDVAAEFFDGMSREQLLACARSGWVTIGSHTISHPFLTRSDDARLQRELAGSREFLQTCSGQAVDLLAYPTGDYDRRVAAAVQHAGYRAAFAVDSRNLGLPVFEIPRIGIYRANPAYLDAKLCGLYRKCLIGHLAESFCAESLAKEQQ